MQRIKITGRNAAQLKSHSESVFNILNVIACHGDIPTDYERKYPNSGRVWTRESDKIDFAPISNNWHGFVRNENETELIFDLSFRYDKENVRVTAIGAMLAACFDFIEIEL